MRSLRFVLFVALLPLLTTLTFAQADAQKPAASPHDMHKAEAAAPSEAQKSFTVLKALAGLWEGRATIVPPQPEIKDGDIMHVSLRVTSRGNAMVHEMFGGSRPKDPTAEDNPITMLYLDGDRLMLTHYCDAGNRPRMVARVSPDGKKVEFDFLDVAGSTKYGHMDHAVFTIIDNNHHVEEWTYLMPGNKPVHARMDLQRVSELGSSGQ